MKRIYPLFFLCLASLSALAAQVQIDTLATGLLSPTRIISDGEQLYFGTGSVVNTYDLSAPDPQVETLYTGISGELGDMVLLGTDLYITEFFVGNLLRLDLSVSPPTVTNIFSGQLNINGLIEQDSVFYFTRSQAGSLYRYDLTATEPTVELLVDQGLGYPGPMEINGDQLYVSCLFGDSLALVDLSNDPIVSEPLGSPIARPIGQLLVDDRLYVASLNGNSILIYDVNDFSAAPDTIGGFDRPSDMVFVGDELYVTDLGAGQLLRVTLQLPGEQCSNAIAVDELFGQATGEAQTSGVYDNTGYNVESDPDFGFDCFTELSFSTDPPLNNTIFFSFVGDGNTYRIAAPPCNATNPINNNDTQIALYSGACDNLTAVVCNDDIDISTDLSAAVTVETEIGEQYYFLVDGFSYMAFGEFPTGEFCVEVTNLTVSSVTDLLETSIDIFPNPTSGILQLPDLDIEQIAVYNLLGSRIADFRQPGNTIDLGHLPTGTYVLRITDTSGKVYASRVIKN